MKKLVKSEMFVTRATCLTFEEWKAAGHTGNKGVWREWVAAHVMGDPNYKGLSRSKYSDRRARDILVGGRRTEVKSLRCSLDLPVGKFATVAEAVEEYFSKATATQYVFCYCSGKRCDGGKISLAVMLPADAKEFMLATFKMDAGKCRWTAGAHQLDDFIERKGYRF